MEEKNKYYRLKKCKDREAKQGNKEHHDKEEGIMTGIRMREEERKGRRQDYLTHE